MGRLHEGVISVEDLKDILPPKERLEKGPVAIIECIESIPCDPCSLVCKQGAIIKPSISTPPRVDYDKCIGCGACVPICPGLAIFMVDYTCSEDKGLVYLPYEFTPLPEKGEEVIALNREGKEVGMAEVVKVITYPDKTSVVCIAVDKDLVMEVRFFRRKENGEKG